MRRPPIPAAIYALLRRLPPRLQKRVIFLFTPKVSLGVSAVIRDASGRVLLLHHSYRRPAWGFPSGLVGRGEQPPDAMARELGEELHARATVDALLHAQGDPVLHHLTLYYGATLQDAPRCDGREVDALRFAEPGELPSLLGYPTPPWLAALLYPPPPSFHG